jgi:uncharacterized membrane protein
MLKQNITEKLFVILLVVILAGAGYISYRCFEYKAAEGGDIFYIYTEGDRILHGQNPYERVLSSDMKTNDKYATYFPLFYLAGTITQIFGLRNFPEWLIFWRAIFMLTNMGFTYIIFNRFFKERLYWLAVFSALFWVFNRWTVFVVKVAQIDILAMFFLVISLFLLERNRLASLLLFGISLAIKQIGILLMPLYLIRVWNLDGAKPERLINIAKAFLQIVAIPALVSLPFIIWNYSGFMKSVLFSMTRSEVSFCNVISITGQAGLCGMPAKLPMLFLILLAYLSYAKHWIGIYSSALFVMFVFINFNSVLFPQYMIWAMPFIPLSVLDIRGHSKIR